MGETRFTVLDSWRGIAACMVALMHVNAYSHIEQLALVRNAYLFVDFFFVLSGFVIASTYQERIAGGFSVGRFMLLRLGRLYPLHLAVLAAFWAYDFPAADRAGTALSHLLLVHSLGEVQPTLWNVPSWSISTELFAYLAFALAVSATRGKIERLLAVTLVALPIVIYVVNGDMSATHRVGLVRCLYGFAAGAAAWHVFRRFQDRIPSGTAAEAWAVAAVLVFVMGFGRDPLSIAAPAVFAATLLVFARQGGAVSRILTRRPFLFLGTVSYSIYMTHYFIARRSVELVAFAKRQGISLFDSLGADRWAGDVALLIYLGIVVVVSAVTYTFVEAPCRDWVRRHAQRHQRPARAPA
jgi:peptidoglycan/LPS O-acetylase OafA/YrhL